MVSRRQSQGRRTWRASGTSLISTLHRAAWPPEHMTIGTTGPTKHMRRHIRPPVLHLGHAVLHSVEARPRLSHHPLVSRLAHRVKSHSRHRSPPMKHHSWHLWLRLALLRHSLSKRPCVLPRCTDVPCWYLLGCGGILLAVGFGSACLLRNPFSIGFFRDAIHAVDFKVYAFSPFLRVGYPGKRASVSSELNTTSLSRAIRRCRPSVEPFLLVYQVQSSLQRAVLDVVSYVPIPCRNAIPGIRENTFPYVTARYYTRTSMCTQVGV